MDSDTYHTMHQYMNKKITASDKILGTVKTEEWDVPIPFKMFVSEEEVMIIRFNNMIVWLRKELQTVLTDILSHNKVVNEDIEDIRNSVSEGISYAFNKVKRNRSNIEIANYYKDLTEKEFYDLVRVAINEATKELLGLCYNELIKLEKEKEKRLKLVHLEEQLVDILEQIENLYGEEEFTNVYNKIINARKEHKKEEVWVCAYCGSRVSINEKTCPNCSGSRAV